ncbi:MAG TPA: GWxTD domain-containing protein [Thermoanaerobaculia bacterium]|nr:GWxTD domain-containing protein [Thermoanaerobaculia bacterium]
MKNMFRILIVSTVLTIIAGAAFAQLSPEYRDWAKGPVQFIMTADEQAKFSQIKTDADAKAFVDLFWARRDPTPGTPQNEYQADFEQRVKYADEHFNEGRRKGSLTDRGRILMLLSAPSRIERSGAQSTTGVGIPGEGRGADQNMPKQVWVYDKPPVSLGPAASRISFVDQFQNGMWSLERGTGLDVMDVTRRVQQATIVSPNLTEAPKAQAAPAASAQTLPVTPPAPSTAAGIGTIKTASLKTAIDEFKAAKSSPYKSISVGYTELLSPTGEFFVPVQLYVPKSAELTAAQVTTFFGTVEDATGNAVAMFEEPATLSTSNGDLYFDRSLTNLKPGTYKAILGLSDKDGKPVVITSAPMELKALAKEETAISRLVLSSDVHQTETAAVAGAPYAFGRVKIVPKGDHNFTNKDELTYFIEIVNPGIDEATNMPKLQVKLELVGTGTKEKPGRTISAPITDATPLPLTGAPGPGQYAIMAGIPLGEMKTPLPAGDYTLRVKVYDQVKKLSWTAEQPLKLTAAAAAPATTTSK